MGRRPSRGGRRVSGCAGQGSTVAGPTLASDSSSHDTVGAFSGRTHEGPDDAQFALLALTAFAVALAVVVAALALWKGLVVVLLLFLAYTLAAAVRPSVERLLRLGVPRWAAVLAHVAALVGALAVVLWVLVPRVAPPGAAGAGRSAGGRRGPGGAARRVEVQRAPRGSRRGSATSPTLRSHSRPRRRRLRRWQRSRSRSRAPPTG